MTNKLDLASPAVVKSGPVISSHRGRIVLRIMVNRARKALEDHTKFENTVHFLTKLMGALSPAERAEIAQYISAKPIETLRCVRRGREQLHVLLWDEGDMRFAAIAKSQN